MQAAMLRILAAALWSLAVLRPQAAWAEGPAPSAAAVRSRFEGAVGLQLNNAPQYQGSDARDTTLKPGIYLRWGRFSVATAGNFVSRHDDEVQRGASAELVQRDDLRVRLGLRFDPGRKTSDSPELAQLDAVRSTLRARLSAAWRFRPDWQLGAGWSTDVLGRKTGGLVDVSLAHEIRLSPRTHWSLGTILTWADERYTAAYFGISPAAALRSGKPAYEPGAGWRDVALSTQLRTDIDRRWTVWTGLNLSRLLGPTRDSPLTVEPTQATVGAGFAWRF
jgi:outer membrane scaffolding protein for murein synthesis (MipA/OmpV family)